LGARYRHLAPDPGPGRHHRYPDHSRSRLRSCLQRAREAPVSGQQFPAALRTRLGETRGRNAIGPGHRSGCGAGPMTTDLRGCIPILCTPFLDDLSVDYQSLERRIDWVIAEGGSGVATLALASEGYKLTESERDEITRVVVATTNGRVPVVVSADGGSPDVAIDRALRAQRAGADALMVLPSSFVKPGPAALRDYYVRIGQAVEIPVIIQDAPQLTGVAMNPALWAPLRAGVETIQYVKAEGVPQGQTLTATLEQSEGRLTVF